MLLLVASVGQLVAVAAVLSAVAAAFQTVLTAAVATLDRRPLHLVLVVVPKEQPVKSG